MGLDSEPHPQNTQLNFSKGQEVEVSSDEDGFRGAWYVATILELPATAASTSASAKSASYSSKKKKKLLIEYKTLVKEDGHTPLTESVDLAYVRPLPPAKLGNGNGFNENDVVDVGYRDGWWTGVVRKVLDGGEKYRVYFDNPPDIIEFHLKDLRPHYKWVNGNWVSPDKQQTTGSSIFSSGTSAEVNIDKENVCDAWFPAVVVKENGDNTFLVKYQSSVNTDEGATKVTVDSHHIRPVPPLYADRNFELLEKVEAYYDCGWRSGLITKLLAGRRYNIYFKHGNVERELNHLKIRPYAEWIDGKWICRCKGVMLASDNQKQLDNIHSNTDNLDMSMKLESSGAAEDMTEEKTPCFATIRDLLEQSTSCNKKTPSNVLPPSKKIKLTAPNGSGMRSCSSKKSTDEDAIDVPLSVSVLPLTKMPIGMPTIETLRDLATRRTAGKRTRSSKKSIASELAVTKTEITPAQKKEVVPQSNSILIRIKELPEKNRQQKVAEEKSQKLDIVTRKGRHTKSPFRSPQVSAAVDAVTNINESGDEYMANPVPVVIALEANGTQDCDDQSLKLMKDQKNLNDSAGGLILGHDLLKRGGSSQRRKRGRPRKLVLISRTALDSGREDHGIRGIANEIVVKNQPINEVEMPIQTKMNSTGKTTGVAETDCLTKDTGMPIANLSNAVVDDDQPLSTWIGGMHSSASAEELASGRPSNELDETSGRHVDLAMVYSVKEAQGDSTPDEGECLPFVKRSLVWKTIESMEIFRIIPQKPHFRPLADCKEEYREGSAIGIMVTFASLFDKITSLKFDDSESVLASTLESLVDLEKHGFDVTMPRNRVEELLSIKNRREEYLNESKDVEKQLREQTDERGKLDAKINDIEKKIIELQEELAASKSMMETKEKTISELQLRMDSMKDSLSNSQDSFEKIARAPWKLP